MRHPTRFAPNPLVFAVAVIAFYARGQVQTWVVAAVNFALALALGSAVGELSNVGAPWNYMLAGSFGLLVLAVGLALSPFLVSRAKAMRKGEETTESFTDRLQLLIYFGEFLRWWVRVHPEVTADLLHHAAYWARTARTDIQRDAPEFSLDFQDEDYWYPSPSLTPDELAAEIRVRQREIGEVLKEMKRREHLGAR